MRATPSSTFNGPVLAAYLVACDPAENASYRSGSRHTGTSLLLEGSEAAAAIRAALCSGATASASLGAVSEEVGLFVLTLRVGAWEVRVIGRDDDASLRDWLERVRDAGYVLVHVGSVDNSIASRRIGCRISDGALGSASTKGPEAGLPEMLETAAKVIRVAHRVASAPVAPGVEPGDGRIRQTCAAPLLGTVEPVPRGTGQAAMGATFH